MFTKRCLSAVAALVACGVPAMTAVEADAALLLDFGPTTPTGSNLINSPYHNATGSAADDWNILGTADSSSLVFSDGSSATGVTVDLGRSADSNTIVFANQPSSSNTLGVRINTGVFSGNSVGTDGIFHGSGGDNNRLGVQISGLAPGAYDVFVNGINTNIAPSDSARVGLPQQIGALATSLIATLDTTSLDSVLVENYDTDENDPITTWVEASDAAAAPDGTYARFLVTLTAGSPNLTIFSYADNDDRGFFNSIQIARADSDDPLATPVPEPATFALLVLGGAALLRRRR